MTVKILADENIPALDGFDHLGAVRRVAGRAIDRDALGDAEVLLVRSVTRVDEALLRGSSVRFVASATAGMDHLDTDYLTRNGIGWACAPGSNADSVVDYVISVICCTGDTLERLLAGASVGIVGLGQVGSRLYRRLSALGVRCVAYDPFLQRSQYPVLDELDRVLACDVLCLHTPLTTAGAFPTQQMIGTAALAAMAPGALLINAGRGGVVDENALLDSLCADTGLRYAADVWAGEPRIRPELVVRSHIATPHIAGYALDGKRRGTAMIYAACCRHLGVAPQAESGLYDRAEQVAVEASGSLSALIREAVLACYDVRADDARLRRLFIEANDAAAATGFDALRKNYPPRREFSACRVVDDRGGSLQPSQLEALRALGFAC